MGKNILPDIVGLIYLKHNQFIPFIDIYRNNIECCEVVNDKQTESARLVYKNDKFYIYFGKNFIDEYNLTLDDIVFYSYTSYFIIILSIMIYSGIQIYRRYF